jgi:hypothetical protein
VTCEVKTNSPKLGDVYLFWMKYRMHCSIFVKEVNMAVITYTYKHNPARIALINKRDALMERLIPRRCMLIPAGLILAGLSIPLLMAVELLPASLLLALVGFLLVFTGGVFRLINCGEIK